MANGNPRIAYVLRLIAVIGGLIALAGIGALVLLGLVAASESGVEIPIHLSLPSQGKALLLYGGGGAFLAGSAVNIFGNAIAGFFEPTHRRPAPPSDEAVEDGPRDARSAVPLPERYRHKLSRTYAFLAGFVLLLLAVDVFVRSLAGPRANSFVDFALLFAHYGVRLLFGSPLGAAIVALLLGGLAYGVHVRASEALLAGVVVAVLFLPTAIATQSLGFAIASLWLLYYSFRARSATEFRVADLQAVPSVIRGFVQE